MVLGAHPGRGRGRVQRNGLLILSVLSVTVGCLLGFFLRTERLSPQVRHVGHQQQVPVSDGWVGLRDLKSVPHLHGSRVA